MGQATHHWEASSGPTTGLRKRGDVYYVQFKEDGRWRLQAVGRDLAKALKRHRELRGDTEPAPATGVAFDVLVERWLVSQETRCRPQSVRSSRQRAKTLLKFFSGQVASGITPNHIEEYVRWRREQGVCDVSVNADLTTLRQVLRFGHLQAGILPQAPARVRLLRTVKKRRRRTFGRAEVAKLVEAAGRMGKEHDEAFIRIAASTGLRVDEILHLTWDDVDFEGRRIDVRAKEWTERRYDRNLRRVVDRTCSWRPKSHQERSIWVSGSLVSSLRAFRGDRRDGWLFVGRTGLRRTTISKSLRDVFKWAGVYEKGKLAHTFRHSVATALLSDGVDLEVVRDVLGHQQIATTAIYLHATDERKKAAAKRLRLVG